MGVYLLVSRMSRHWSRLLRLIFGGALLLLVAHTANTAAQDPGVPAEDRLVFVVHRSNPTENLTLAELRRYLRGERRKWPNGRNVTVVMRNPGALERATVLREIYGMNEDEFARYFLHAAFVGDVAGPPKQVNSAHWMARFVFNVPGAIGYLRASELDDAVKPLRIGGVGHHDPEYPLVITPDPEDPSSDADGTP